MLSLQEGIKSLTSDKPNSLYFFTGPEYGVKVEYLNILSKFYKGLVEEYQSLNDLVTMFSSRSLLPRIPTLYIVRYDETYVKNLKADEASKLLSLNIVGTIVALYQDDKFEAKLDKFFPDNVLRINTLAPHVKKKHLQKQFESIPDMYIDAIVEISSDYYEAIHMCQRLSLLSTKTLCDIPIADIKNLFQFRNEHNTDRFKLAIAARNFPLAYQEIQKYEGDVSSLFYDFLNTLLEIIKSIEKKNSETLVRKYVNLWDLSGAKAMFNVAYDQLEKLRKYSNYSAETALIYTCALLQYRLG